MPRLADRGHAEGRIGASASPAAAERGQRSAEGLSPGTARAVLDAEALRWEARRHESCVASSDAAVVMTSWGGGLLDS